MSEEAVLNARPFFLHGFLKLSVRFAIARQSHNEANFRRCGN